MRAVRTDLAVRTAHGTPDQDNFIALPFRLYADDPYWVAPLIADLHREFDRRRNPFFKHGEAAFFLAERNGRVVGRLSVHTDERYNAFHTVDGQRDTTGFWGFFECEEDQHAAELLFDAGSAWLAEHGKTTMVGPASFTLNDVCGLLVDGFDSIPAPLMAYNPPYYADLVGSAGFTKVQDLWAYRLDALATLADGIRAFAHSAEDEGFTFRTMDARDYWGEVRRFMDVYNHAWERNWGFVPLTEAEMHVHAKRLRRIIDPELIFIAERSGLVAGASLTIPNINEELVAHRGHLGASGTARLLRRVRRHDWTSCRVVALGVKHEYRETGVGAHLYLDTLDAAQRLGYEWGEMSWVLESNEPMNAGIRRMGGEISKTYRMYSRPTH